MTNEVAEERRRIAATLSDCISSPELEWILAVVNGSPGAFRLSVAESVKKERERCAGIARDFGRPRHDTNCGCVVCDGCRESAIAAVILRENHDVF